MVSACQVHWSKMGKLRIYSAMSKQNKQSSTLRAFPVVSFAFFYMKKCHKLNADLSLNPSQIMKLF